MSDVTHGSGMLPLHDDGTASLQAALDSSLDQARRQADDVVDHAARVLQDAVGTARILDVLNGLGEETRYVVDMSAELKEMINSKAVTLDRDSLGNLYAQLRKNGKFSDKLPIREETVGTLDVAELSQAVQMQAVMDKLEQIADALDRIGTDVADVLLGQQNDRVGLLMGAQRLYREAAALEDRTFQKFLLAQALQSLSEAGAQMEEQVKAELRSLEAGEYLRVKRGREEEIDRRLANVNRALDVVHRATLLKAVIYQSQGELRALVAGLEEYGSFLRSWLLPAATFLNELESPANLLRHGSWTERVEVLEGASEVARILDKCPAGLLPAVRQRNEE